MNFFTSFSSFFSILLRLVIFFLFQLLYVCIHILQIQVQAQTIETLDTQYGLFGISLESPLDSLPNKQFRGKKMKKEVYTIEKQPLFLGEAKLSNVQYVFYKNRLHSIILQTDNAKDSQNLLLFLDFFYGPGTQEGFSPLYVWQGKKVKMIYEQNVLTKASEVVIMSLAMEKEFQKEWVPANK